MLQRIATIFGALAFMLALVPMTVVLSSNAVLFMSSVWMTLGALLFIALGAIAALVVVRMLVLSIGVLLLRGPAYVGWDFPSRCADFSAWLVADWHFLGQGGVHRGERLLGLSVAVIGTL